MDKHFAKVRVDPRWCHLHPAALKATFAAETDAQNALDQSRAQLKEQVATARAARAKASAARKGLKAYVLGNFGAQAVNVLADFGMSPPKSPGPKTAIAKAQAAARAKATREARHTMGKRERLAIKADPVTLVANGTEVASAAAPAPAAAPSVVPNSTPAHS